MMPDRFSRTTTTVWLANMNSQLQLKRISLLELNLKANPDYSPDNHAEPTDETEFNFIINPAERDSERRGVLLIVSINKRKAAFKKRRYSGSFSAFAEFEFHDVEDLAGAGHRFLPNMLAMTYSTLRGLVASSTGMGIYGTWFLPTINFVEVVQRQLEDGMSARANRGQVTAEVATLPESNEHVV